MNVKISVNPKNNGSSSGYMNYLNHEVKEGISQDETFFNHRSDNISKQEAIFALDNNKNALGKDQDKFYDVIASPSAKEWEAMGKTDKERMENFKNFIKNEFIEAYADNFNKGLKKDDIMYFAKIHEYREGVYAPHAHVVVSRKDMSDKIKLSPLTNHRGTTKGAVKGGFDRMNFFEKSDKVFDEKFNYNRDFADTLTYQHTMKHGKAEDVIKLPKLKEKHLQEQQIRNERHQQQTKEQTKDRKKGFGMSF